MVVMIYPESLLAPRKVDAFFADEAGRRGDYLLRSEDGSVRGVNPDEIYLYRGWILTSDEYRITADNVANQGGIMAVTPTDYDSAQFVPGWFPYFKYFTPDTAVLPFNSNIHTIEQAADSIGYPLVIKGQSKSLKSYWLEGMYVPSKEALLNVIEFFKEHSDPWEGIVLRKFEEWEPAEQRLWIVDGQVVFEENHSDSNDKWPISDTDLNQQKSVILELVKALDSRFCTVDLTCRKDGVIRVVEVGSGLVSSGNGAEVGVLELENRLAALGEIS